jgi:hypothetical protein
MASKADFSMGDPLRPGLTAAGAGMRSFGTLLGGSHARQPDELGRSI